MSRTSISNNQWIQHAIAAARAGSPSVAKTQLQKAAEDSPGEPAIWLWLGWLADSPASAVQCLEIARSDSRFQKIAEAGIEFTKALAEFNLDELRMQVTSFGSVAETPEETIAEPDDPCDEVCSVADPVESVEEVSAAVDTLWQQDKVDVAEPDAVLETLLTANGFANSEITDGADKSSKEVTEESADEAVHSERDHLPDQAVSERSVSSVNDETETGVISDDGLLDAEELVAADEPADEVGDSISDDPATVNSVGSAGLTDSAIDVEAELMKSAQDPWQAKDTSEKSLDDIVEPSDPKPHGGEKFCLPAMQIPQKPAVSVEDSPADESEDDFVFAADEDSVFDAAPGVYRSSPLMNGDALATDKVNAQRQVPTLNTNPAAPVWRKAQSDWFSVDGPSVPEPEQTTVPASAPKATPDIDSQENASALSSTGSDEYLPDTESQSVKSDVVENVELIEATITTHPATDVVDPTEAESAHSADDSETAVDENSERSSPITASNVWESAAIESSTPAMYPFDNTLENPSAFDSYSSTTETALAEAFSQAPLVESAATTSEFSPPSQSSPPMTSDRDSAAETSGQKTVLVVDDSPTVRKLVSITLEKRGYKVAAAFDGVAAIKEIAAHNPSLILMDVNMPRLDGYQLCKLVKKHETTCDIPVLMLSGKDGIFDRLRGKLVGCAGYVTKPFTPEVLVEAVEQQLRHGIGR